MYDNYLKGYTYTLISISWRPDRDGRIEGKDIPQDEQTVENSLPQNHRSYLETAFS